MNNPARRRLTNYAYLRAWLATLLMCMAMPLAAGERTLLIFGDSLSAGYGIPQSAAWPSLLSQRLAGKYNVINASISGETTAGGRTRLPALLRMHEPGLVIIALGANDGLRGLALSAMQENLTAMIAASHQRGARVLLIGMRLPPNYGAYAGAFANSFEQVARQTKVALLPFLLEGIGDRRELFLADGLHPGAEAQAHILNHVWPSLAPLLPHDIATAKGSAG